MTVNISTKAVAGLAARIDAWDRSWPGNVWIEGCADEAAPTLRALAAERDALRAEVAAARAEEWRAGCVRAAEVVHAYALHHHQFPGTSLALQDAADAILRAAIPPAPPTPGPKGETT